MKFKIFIAAVIVFFFCSASPKAVFALEHTQRNGLFSMNVPEGWHWIEYPQDVVITFPNGKDLAIDIQMVPSRKLSEADMKKIIKDGNDKMIKQGIEAHHGILLDDKETTLDGVYATRLDFETSDLVFVTYISCFNKGYAFTITYGSNDQNMHAVMDDAVATFKFK